MQECACTLISGRGNETFSVYFLVVLGLQQTLYLIAVGLIEKFPFVLTNAHVVELSDGRDFAILLLK